jgi:hypothetical protein
MKRNDERRLLKRDRRRLSARIVDGTHVIHCYTIDITATGARLDVPRSDLVPRFSLLRVPERRLEQEVELVWRRGCEIGVFFVQNQSDTSNAKPSVLSKPLPVASLRRLVGR